MKGEEQEDIPILQTGIGDRHDETFGPILVRPGKVELGHRLADQARYRAGEVGAVVDAAGLPAADLPGVGLESQLGEELQVAAGLARRLELGEEYGPSYGRGDSYQAWQEVDVARRLWRQEGREREAFAHLKRALEIDSTFDAARGLSMIWHLNFGEMAQADSMSRALAARVSVIPPRQRWQLAVHEAVLRRDAAAALDAAVTPGTISIATFMSREAASSMAVTAAPPTPEAPGSGGPRPPAPAPAPRRGRIFCSVQGSCDQYSQHGPISQG